ncbi:MAG: hypothetical protein L0228_19440 [Planctomycetes bacterium]|nr:hypothetical protein [Planctomycetota bacterium]
MNQKPSLRYSLLVAVVGLCAGIAVGFGVLWLAADAETLTTADRTLLPLIAAGCVFLGIIPWPRKRPTPGGLAE